MVCHIRRLDVRRPRKLGELLVIRRDGGRDVQRQPGRLGVLAHVFRLGAGVVRRQRVRAAEVEGFTTTVAGDGRRVVEVDFLRGDGAVGAHHARCDARAGVAEDEALQGSVRSQPLDETTPC